MSGGHMEDFDWDTLGSSALHPVRVESVEALRWIGLPLSAADLVSIFEGRRMGLRVEYHRRCLFKLGVVRLENREMAPAPIGQRPYCLTEQATA